MGGMFVEGLVVLKFGGILIFGGGVISFVFISFFNIFCGFCKNIKEFWYKKINLMY